MILALVVLMLGVAFVLHTVAIFYLLRALAAQLNWLRLHREWHYEHDGQYPK